MCTCPEKVFNSTLPPGLSTRHMNQDMLILDAEFQQGRFEARAEGYLNEWRVPRIGRLDARGVWGEARLGVGARTWLAIRAETLRYSSLTSSAGVRQPWDHDRSRWESGAGIRVNRDVRVKLVWQRNVERLAQSRSRTEDMRLL